VLRVRFQDKGSEGALGGVGGGKIKTQDPRIVDI
jgi:hypothetical protein